MKRARPIRILAAAAIVLLAAGCSVAPGATSGSGVNQIAAKDLATTIADPTTGTVQEMTDLGSAFFGIWALGLQSRSLERAPGLALFLEEGLRGGQLAWSSANSDYELNLSRSITAGAFTGSATVSISVAFLTSTDGSGTGIQVSPLTSGAATLSSIHSIAYTRHLQADFTNSVTHVERKSDSTSSFVVTALTVGGSNPGFTVSGSKTVAFTHIYSDGTTVIGNLSQTISSSSPVVVSAVLQSDGSYLVTATGTILVSYDATITKADGTTSTVSHTATVTLDGQRTLHVDMEGTEVDADTTTGETE
jgi:hypothetical protein